MADLPKRVWSGKKQVYSGKKPVWVKDGKLGVYDPNFEEVTSGQYYSPNRWGNVSADAELQIYDDKDSLNPTDIGTFEDGLESTYQFVDYDGTVLKSGKVKDGETPVAPANPTREHYTFTGWNPTVGPISKNTTYSAMYVIDKFTLTFTVNDDSYGSVSPTVIENVPYGMTIISDGNLLIIGADVVTATAETGYQFSSWGTLPEIVTEDLTITATFETAGYTVTVSSLGNGQVKLNGGDPEDSVTISGIQPGTPIYTFGQILSIGFEEITVIPDDNYYFTSWASNLPATVTENLTIYANFTDDIIKNVIFSDTLGQIVHYPQEGTIVISYNGTDPNITQTQFIIGDRNLWAREYFGQTADNLVLSSGKIFQWGNNNPFEYGNVPLDMIHNSKISVAGYVNYPSEFRTSQFYNNDEQSYGDNQYDDNGNIYNIQNLWGDYTDTDVARKGPCPSGWHLPSAEECNNLFLILQEFSNAGFQNDNPFLMPLYNNVDLLVIEIDGRAGTRAELWTSDFVNDPDSETESGYNVTYNFGEAEYVRSAYLGLQVRPFKNSSPL